VRRWRTYTQKYVHEEKRKGKQHTTCIERHHP
jgi:hypothetical protein